jgi:acetyl-CoA carboxylase biotin carboxyl carrier protein
MADPKKARPNTSSGTPNVDLPEVERLLEFMGKHGLEEFEYERDSFRIRLKKPSINPAAPMSRQYTPEIVVAGTAQAAGNSGGAAAGTAAAGGGGREASGDAGRDDLHIIKSPIVGTFYAAPTPGASAFVGVGDQVKSGQVLCIIEAMKLMNEIEADADGEVMRVFVENGQPVEYGEPLFGIHPNRRK